MEVKLNIGNPKDGKTVTHTIPDGKPLYGIRLGQEFKGELIDKTGYVFKVAGGSDNAGFPMRSDVEGAVRRKVLLAGGVGFKPKRDGIRRRVTVSGNSVGPNTAQVNCVVVKAGSAPLVEPPAEEAPAAE